MHGTTTGKDLYEEVSRFANDMELTWGKLVRLTTDSAPTLCGHKSGLVARIWERKKDDTGEVISYHCIIHQESLCGKALTNTKFIKANHHQFKAFLEELNSEYGDLLLSYRGAVIKPGKGVEKVPPAV